MAFTKIGAERFVKSSKELTKLCLEYRKTLVKEKGNWENKDLLKKQAVLSKKTLKVMKRIKKWLETNIEIIERNDNVRKLFIF